jgi:phosphate uptake regulator
MVFRIFRSGRHERLVQIEEKFLRMLADDRKIYDLAMAALFGDVDPRDVNNEIRDTDYLVNRAEREIRRELVVHASVVGAIETPAILIYMSIVKDIERVGDYAKNLVDLALDGANFSEGPDLEEWREVSGKLSQFISSTAEAFKARDTERVRVLLTEGDELLSRFDDAVSEMVSGRDQRSQAVARALALRYLKRVLAHLMNVLTSVVMPVHLLDYFDEDPEDRDDRRSGRRRAPTKE